MSFGGQTPTIIVLKEGKLQILPTSSWEPLLICEVQARIRRKERDRLSVISMLV
jgi:hypothetical protein